MSASKVYELFATVLHGYGVAVQCNNPQFQEIHRRQINELEQRFLPSGAGFDNGCTIDLKKSTPERLEILTHFHHMNSGGFYDGWSDHRVIVTPSLLFGFKLEIQGEDRNDVHEHIEQTFSEMLGMEAK